MRFKAVFVSFVLAFTLVACSPDEVSLLSAFEKTSNAAYYEIDSEVSFLIDYSGGDEEFVDTLSRIKRVADAVKIGAKTAYEGSADGNKMKMHVQSSSALDPLTLAWEAWFDMDVIANDPKMDFIIKMPALFQALLPEEYAKEYLLIDYIKLLEDDVPYISYNLLADAKKRQMEVVKAVAASGALSGIYDVKSRSEGEHTVIRISLSDAQLKNAIVALAQEVKTNDELLDVFVSIAADFVGNAPNIVWDKTEIREDLQEALSRSLAIMEVEYSDGFTLLGKRGFTYEAFIDKDGYLVKDRTVVSLSLEPFMYYQFAGLEEASAYVDINIAKDYHNIGGSGKVELPLLTQTNSTRLTDAIEAEERRNEEERIYSFPNSWYYHEMTDQMPNETPVDFTLKGTFNGNPIDRQIKVMKYEEGWPNTFISLHEAKEIFGGEIAWNEELRLAKWERDGATCYLYPRYHEGGLHEDVSDEILNEYYPMYDGYINQNSIYISLEDIEWFTDADFGYDKDSETILIREQ